MIQAFETLEGNVLQDATMKTKEGMRRQASITDVARLAGVSVGTVSHALNSVGYVKQETKERILKAAEELNYVPNRAGRILKTSQTKLVMLAIPDTSNEIYFGMIEGVQNEIKAQGYSLLLYYTNGELEEELHAVRLLQERVVDGLILVHFSYSPILLEEIERCSGPVVLLGMCNHLWAGKGYNFDTVSIDVYSGIYTAVRHLVKIGHRKIGYLAGRKDVDVYRQRFDAYKDALEASEIEYREEYVYWNDWTQMGGYSGGRMLYQMRERPTAICASNDLQAIGCWEAVRDLGGRIPKDIALTGLDNLNICKILGITSFDMKENMMGMEAARHLMARLAGKHMNYQNLYFRPELQVRDSSLYTF